jgi:hypothetical protein
LEPNRNYPIATYVHLGPSLPKHLILGINRHRKIFPDQKITLIVDHEIDETEFSDIDIFKVNSEVLEQDLFLEMSKYLDYDFRQNFWKFTFQRFFAIHLYHSTLVNEPLLHIESDVLLLPNFPWKTFLDLGTLAWLQVNDSLDVAALVYFPNAQATQFLNSQLKEYALNEPSINDMLALRKFAIEFPEKHTYLPSRTNTTIRGNKKLSHAEKEALSRFGGIFDPLMLGLWYFGQDPKNSFGFCRRYIDDESHSLSPMKSELTFKEKSLRMKDSTSVFSLHIHSKKLGLFGSNWSQKLEIGLKQASMRSNQVSFEWTALLKSLEGRSKREKIWQLLGAVPLFQNLRKINALEKIKDKIKRLMNP